MKTKRLCICGCGRKLTGAPQQRRHPKCRRQARIDRTRRWREKKRETPEYKRRAREAAARLRERTPEKIRDRMRFLSRKRQWRDRKAAIKAYGGKCVCCGECNVEFLTLSHPHGDGHQHRKEVCGKHHRTGAGMFLRRLRMAGFPNMKYKIEVLCWNCHMAIEFHGICPHEHENEIT